MTESSLSVDFTELKERVGKFLGHGSTSGNWTAAQLADITAIIKRGIRQFYNPPIMNEDGTPHLWTFLRPLTNVTTTSGTNYINLDDDFGGIDGDITFNTYQGINCVKVISEENIRKLYQKHRNATGVPQFAAVLTIESDGSGGQRYQLLIYPEPDDEYTLVFKNIVLPNELTADNPYPLGGMMHGETILESCLAIAELDANDEIGIHHMKFMERLKASIQYDKRAITEEYLGYNGDESERSPNRYRGDHYVSYEGTIY